MLFIYLISLLLLAAYAAVVAACSEIGKFAKWTTLRIRNNASFSCTHPVAFVAPSVNTSARCQRCCCCYCGRQQLWQAATLAVS